MVNPAMVAKATNLFKQKLNTKGQLRSDEQVPVQIGDLLSLFNTEFGGYLHSEGFIGLCFFVFFLGCFVIVNMMVCRFGVLVVLSFCQMILIIWIIQISITLIFPPPSLLPLPSSLPLPPFSPNNRSRRLSLWRSRWWQL